MYMLKSCPIVRSLGKLIEKGYAFVWGKGFPFLVPPNVDYSIEVDHEACVFADRVDGKEPFRTSSMSQQQRGRAYKSRLPRHHRQKLSVLRPDEVKGAKGPTRGEEESEAWIGSISPGHPQVESV